MACLLVLSGTAVSRSEPPSVAADGKHGQQQQLVQPLRTAIAKGLQTIFDGTAGFIGIAAQGTEQPIPEGEDLSVIAVGFSTCAGMVNAMKPRRDEYRAQRAVERIG